MIEIVETFISNVFTMKKMTMPEINPMQKKKNTWQFIKSPKVFPPLFEFSRYPSMR